MKHGAAWYAKYRLPDGRQVQRKLGPAWTEPLVQASDQTNTCDEGPLITSPGL